MTPNQRISISITLSPAQVDAVMRAATNSRAPDVSTLMGAARLHVDESDPRLSRSLLRGLSLLTRFGPEDEERGIIELANELNMSPSTTHRYASTLVELGLLERCPRTRKYRLPAATQLPVAE